MNKHKCIFDVLAKWMTIIFEKLTFWLNMVDNVGSIEHYVTFQLFKFGGSSYYFIIIVLELKLKESLTMTL